MLESKGELIGQEVLQENNQENNNDNGGAMLASVSSMPVGVTPQILRTH